MSSDIYAKGYAQAGLPLPASRFGWSPAPEAREVTSLLTLDQYRSQRKAIKDLIDEYLRDQHMDAYPEWRNRNIERLEENRRILADEYPQHERTIVLEEVAAMAAAKTVEHVQPREFGLDSVPLNNPMDATPTQG